MLKRFLKIVLYLSMGIGYCSIFANSFDQFFQAAKRNDARTLGSLIQRGFDANTRNEAGETALMIAIREDANESAQLLMRVPKLKADERNPIDETPLMLASLKGRLDWVEALIRLDADVNKTGWTALHYAATGGHLPIAKRLLEQHAYIDAESPNKSTPLMMAAMYGNLQTVRLLLDEGADWKLKNDHGLTAFDFAVQGQRPDAVKLLEDVAAGRLIAGSTKSAGAPAAATSAVAVPAARAIASAANAQAPKAAASQPAGQLPKGGW